MRTPRLLKLEAAYMKAREARRDKKVERRLRRAQCRERKRERREDGGKTSSMSNNGSRMERMSDTSVNSLVGFENRHQPEGRVLGRHQGEMAPATSQGARSLHSGAGPVGCQWCRCPTIVPFGSLSRGGLSVDVTRIAANHGTSIMDAIQVPHVPLHCALHMHPDVPSVQDMFRTLQTLRTCNPVM